MVFQAKVNPTKGEQRPAAIGLMVITGFFAAMDDRAHRFDFHLHQETHTVVNLDIGFHIIPAGVRVDDDLRHVRRQSGDHAGVAYHLRIIVQPLDCPQILVDQLFAGGVVDEA